MAFVFDVDDVIVDLRRAEPGAEAALAETLVAEHGKAAAAQIQDRVQAIRAAIRADLVRAPGDKPRDPRLLDAMRRWQRGAASAGHALKPWSRETWLAIALEEAGLPVRRALVRAAVDAYWDTIARESVVYEDARRLIERLKARGMTFHFATNSDAFLELDERWGTFFYDPVDSRARKLGRLRPLWGLGLEPVMVTVGDPIGKPHAAFYTRALADLGARLARPIAAEELEVVGDSLTHDLEPFLRLGVPRGWLVTRVPGGATTDDARIRTVSDLTALSSAF